MALKDNSFYSENGDSGIPEIRREHLIFSGHAQLSSQINRIKKAYPSGSLITKKSKNKSNVILLNERRATKIEDRNDLILEIDCKEGKDLKIYTGNYIGFLKEGKFTFKITSRFGNSLLYRMMDINNHFNLTNHKIEGKRDNNDIEDIVRHILFRNYIQKLKKSFALGFPKVYRTKRYHTEKIKGNVDIHGFIRKDNPFIGKISSIHNERIIDQDIVSVLYKAIEVIRQHEKIKKKEALSKSLLAPVLAISQELKSTSPKQYTAQIFKKAIQSKSLTNSIYSPYKEALYSAKLIIDNHALDFKGFETPIDTLLIDVSELWERYILNLLQINFPNWLVHSPEITVYKETFFNRKIIPDIVLERENQVIVFDTKYKRMNYKGRSNYGMGDLDRHDFFQIHTYMAYYQGQGKKLLGGGLLYPIEEKKENTLSASDNWLGNNGFFIVDGIEVIENADRKFILKAENEFIHRIKNKLNSAVL